MKNIFIILFIVIAFKIQAQNVLQFENDIELLVTIEKFKLEDHNVETCYFNNDPYYCLIDGEEWFGKDTGLELPKYKLNEIIVLHEGNRIPLNVTQMFNPVFSTTISERHFEVKIVNDQIEIYGWFSDGAGTYCAKWIVTNGSSERILLSNSESDCFE